ncbi:hypothetical protein BDY19DRAFT_587910 [Irpex rosettiformis]|uniref:Uncharacterized protein n=1 Tax=Irpex rosettiformis TaxID=378272 RepID=A0ACB8UD99_9APHY|nr:hypothetical protein BDY19DRAFT_587910 [Irpex rosettiformis]
MPPPVAPQSSRGDPNTLPSHAQPKKSSRSPSQTPRMTSSTLPTGARTVDETIDTTQAPVLSRRPRGQSTSTEPSPSILQLSASPSNSQSPLQQARSQQSHVSFPDPSIKSAQSSSTATPAQHVQTIAKDPSTASVAAVRAAEMGRVASSPFPLPSTTIDQNTHSSQQSLTRTEVRPSRGRSFSFSRLGSNKSRGTSPASHRDWFSRFPGSSIMRRGRPRSGSDSAMHSSTSVNVAEIVSHRVSYTSEPNSGPMHPGLGSRSDISTYNNTQPATVRTVDTGYGYEEESYTARGLSDIWPSSEQRMPWTSASVLDSEHKGTHRSRSRDKQVPEDETFRIAKERVLRATSYIGEGAHELLAIGVDVLEFAPVPGLVTAARVLLHIWDAAQGVDLNQKVCLRLTDRCATILISIREEIEQADEVSSPKASPTLIGSPRTLHLPTPPSGPSPLPGGSGSGKGIHSSPKLGSALSPRDSPRPGKVDLSPKPNLDTLWGKELQMPMERLIGAFNKVLTLLQKQNSRPFLKRYLKREEIQIELSACNDALNDALAVFGVAIQARILKHLLQAEHQRQAEAAALFDHILHSATPPSLQTSQSLPQTTPGFHPGLISPQNGPPPLSGVLGLENVSGLGQPSRLDSIGIPNLPDLESSSYVPPPEITFPVPTHYPVLAPISGEPSKMTSEEVMNSISHLSAMQNSQDLAHDTASLRQLLRRAVATNDDFEMFRVLQVKKEEMPEAIKALQRALEGEIKKEREGKDHAEIVDLLAELEQSTSILGEAVLTSPVQDASVGSVQGIVDGIIGDPALRKKVEQGGLPEASTHATKDDVLSRRATTSTRASKSSSSGESRDTLDREFIESSIESLLRLSTTGGTPPKSLSLPSWTITQYEVIRDTKIGQGNFSEVWRGSYRKRTVAIKVLASWTPKELFLKEVLVWDELRHPNVLELIGASVRDPSGQSKPTHGKGHYESGGLESSTHSTGALSQTSGWDVPEEARSPWFFVSRYYERGSLVKWVKGLNQKVWDTVLDDVGQGVLRMVHEIVRGMVYLHEKGVLHGDLKCANILIDDYGHCIISDFGQSEMKSEAYRISGHPFPHGTLRWQAPELMSGASNLTQDGDVYAFAICCVELLTKGGVPWFMANDDTVRHFVLDQDKRPELPLLRNWSTPLLKILTACWDKLPETRPTFKQLDRELSQLRSTFGWNGTEIVQEGEEEHEKDWIDWIDGLDKDARSPALTVIPLPSLPPEVTSVDLAPQADDSGTCAPTPDSDSVSGSEAGSMYQVYSRSEPALPQLPHTAAVDGSHSAPEPAAHHPSPHVSYYSSRASSIAFPSSTDHSDDYGELPPTPVPSNPRVAEIRNERRYRLTLQHEYHPSLMLPLWTPSPVFVGAVGYHRKPTGSFVTLFNAFNPSDSSEESIQRMSSINGYVQGSGTVPRKEEKLEKRTVAQRGMDLIQGWLSRSKVDSHSSRNIGRRYSTPLRNGHKAAHLFTESTMFHFIDDLSPAKRWFEANIDEIVTVYGPDHPIQREDVLLVICTLDAANYALFVSHHHPDSLVNFNVFSASKPGQPWGKFSIAPDPAVVKHGGPVIHEEEPGIQSASKISVTKHSSDDWDTVLLARLRFAPDKDEPTSL